MAWPNDTRMSGKKFEVSPVEARLSLGIVESVWLVEQSGSRDEAWCSAAVTGGKGVSLGPADCDGGYEKSPLQVSSLYGKS